MRKDRKDKRLMLRLSSKDAEKIRFLAEVEGVSKTEIILRGIEKEFDSVMSRAFTDD